MSHPEEALLIVPADLDTLGMHREYMAHVPADVRAAKCLAAIGYVLSFLGRRAKRPVLTVGEELREAMIIRAYCQCLRYIGYPPDEGADKQFLEAENKNEAYLAMVRDGKVEPHFTDSSPAVAEFGPMGGTSRTADAWAYRDPYAGLYGSACRRRCR
jgi:hypothetical protein